MSSDISQIWADDLFGREQEASDLIGYLESMASNEVMRTDRHGHVIAVDASYGYGKTFFLRRLAEQLATDHPVAFVDAWADDLQDEPLIAIAATLHEALEPFAKGKVKEKLNEFGKKVGAISKVVGAGLLRRAAGLLITQAAADALSEIVELDGESVAAELRKDALKESAKGVAETKLVSGGNIEQKILEFRRGKALLEEVRSSLREIVEALSETSARLPIVILIDELDRCRPTYAIKLLEEVKHLFDVPGVVFVLGMHQDQLTHSVASAYGGTFDARAYLGRFIDRKYSLAPPAMRKLVESRTSILKIQLNRLDAPNVSSGGGTGQLGSLELIGRYLEGCRVSARDCIKIMDAIHICLSLTKRKEVVLPYIIPLIIEKICGLDNFTEQNFAWEYWAPSKAARGYGQDQDYIGHNPVHLYHRIDEVFKQPMANLRRMDTDSMLFAPWLALWGDDYATQPSYDYPRGYRRLTNAVSRFSQSEA